MRACRVCSSITPTLSSDQVGGGGGRRHYISKRGRLYITKRGRRVYITKKRGGRRLYISRKRNGGARRRLYITKRGAPPSQQTAMSGDIGTDGDIKLPEVLYYGDENGSTLGLYPVQDLFDA